MNAGVALRLCTESAKTIRRHRRFEHSMSPRLWKVPHFILRL